MSRHASSLTATARRALAVLATAGVALGAGAATAAADTPPTADAARTGTAPLGHLDPQTGVQAPGYVLPYVT